MRRYSFIISIVAIIILSLCGLWWWWGGLPPVVEPTPPSRGMPPTTTPGVYAGQFRPGVVSLSNPHLLDPGVYDGFPYDAFTGTTVEARWKQILPVEPANPNNYATYNFVWDDLDHDIDAAWQNGRGIYPVYINWFPRYVYGGSDLMTPDWMIDNYNDSYQPIAIASKPDKLYLNYTNVNVKSVISATLRALGERYRDDPRVGAFVYSSGAAGESRPAVLYGEEGEYGRELNDAYANGDITGRKLTDWAAFNVWLAQRAAENFYPAKPIFAGMSGGIGDCDYPQWYPGVVAAGVGIRYTQLAPSYDENSILWYYTKTWRNNEQCGLGFASLYYSHTVPIAYEYHNISAVLMSYGSYNGWYWSWLNAIDKTPVGVQVWVRWPGYVPVTGAGAGQYYDPRLGWPAIQFGADLARDTETGFVAFRSSTQADTSTICCWDLGNYSRWMDEKTQKTTKVVDYSKRSSALSPAESNHGLLNAGREVWIDLDDQKWNTLYTGYYTYTLRVTYKNTISGNFLIVYPASNGTPVTITVPTTNSGTWDTFAATITNTVWSNMLSGGVDIKIVNTLSGDLRLHMLLLSRARLGQVTPTPPPTQQPFTPTPTATRTPTRTSTPTWVYTGTRTPTPTNTLSPTPTTTPTPYGSVAILPATQDTTLDVNSPVARGAEPLLELGNPEQLRALIQFNLGSLPAGNVSIERATLRYVIKASEYSYSTTTLSVYHVTQGWTDDATWINRTATQPWNSAGGDIGEAWTTVGVTISVGLHTIDITPLARYWYTSGTNYGLALLINTAITTGLTLASAEWGASSERPSLEVIYTVLPTPTPTVIVTSAWTNTFPYNPPINTVYGNAFAHSGTVIQGQPLTETTRATSIRLVAEHTGAITQTIVVGTFTGSAITWTMSLRADDGTASHYPSSTELQTATATRAAGTGALTFSHAATTLTAGTIYHIVISSTSSSPTSYARLRGAERDDSLSTPHGALRSGFGMLDYNGSAWAAVDNDCRGDYVLVYEDGRRVGFAFDDDDVGAVYSGYRVGVVFTTTQTLLMSGIYAQVKRPGYGAPNGPLSYYLWRTPCITCTANLLLGEGVFINTGIATTAYQWYGVAKSVVLEPGQYRIEFLAPSSSIPYYIRVLTKASEGMSSDQISYDNRNIVPIYSSDGGATWSANYDLEDVVLYVYYEMMSSYTPTPTPTKTPTQTPVPPTSTPPPTPTTWPTFTPTATPTVTPTPGWLQTATPTPTAAAGAGDSVLLNEIMIYTNQTEGQWVELYNPLTYTISLRGYRLCAVATGDCYYVPGGDVAGGGFVLLYPWQHQLTLTVYSDTLQLYDDRRVLIDNIGWTTTTTLNSSLGRWGDGASSVLELEYTTPGFSNSAPTPTPTKTPVGG